MDDTTREALAMALPQGELRDDDATRVAYGYDNSRRKALPVAVAFPASEAEVAALLRVCNDARLAVTARGLGSATTGAAVPSAGGLVVAFERMDRIVRVDPDDRMIVCEPGVLNSDVQAAARAVGMFWAPDPTSAPYSTIGGNLACNAAGPRAVKYGTPRENVYGLRAVTADGTRIRTGTRTSKGVVGFDLTRLLIGSEGTLALITEAALRLLPLQTTRATLRAIYHDAGSAARAVADIMAGPVTPCALEFMDGPSLSLVRDSAGVELPEDAGALLLIECDGDMARVEADIESVAERAGNAGLMDLQRATDAGEIERLWTCRRELSPAQRRLAPVKINEDVVVPVSRLPELVDGLRGLADSHAVTILSFGHAGNGNLHVNLLGNPDDRPRMEACLADLFDLVLALDGTLSGEHGIGHEKRDFIGREIEPDTLELMRAIKRVFDPRGILNPGKVFPD